jgi:thiosulfate reductase cytochrome b subunit
MFVTIEEVGGWNLSLRLHFCKICGVISFIFLKHEISLILYAQRNDDIDNDFE